MALVKDGAIVEDPWVYAGWLAEAPDGTPVILPLDVWQAEKERLRDRDAPVGLLLHPDDEPEHVADDVDALSLIALEFPAFNDGRAFSQARALRDRLGFKGELRATGSVIVDQKTFLRRCGFDAVELPDEESARTWVAAASPIALYYQPATGDETPLQRLRMQRVAPLVA